MSEKLDNLIKKRGEILDLLLANAIERRKLENSQYEINREIAKEREKEGIDKNDKK
jgi:hypothetical protein